MHRLALQSVNVNTYICTTCRPQVTSNALRFAISAHHTQFGRPRRHLTYSRALHDNEHGQTTSVKDLASGSDGASTQEAAETTNGETNSVPVKDGEKASKSKGSKASREEAERHKATAKVPDHTTRLRSPLGNQNIKKRRGRKAAKQALKHDAHVSTDHKLVRKFKSHGLGGLDPILATSVKNVITRLLQEYPRGDWSDATVKDGEIQEMASKLHGHFVKKIAAGAAGVVTELIVKSLGSAQLSGKRSLDQAEGNLTLKQALLPQGGMSDMAEDSGTFLRGSDIQMQTVDVKQPPVRSLSYGLDRVLFNPGVYRLQDSRSGVYNFDTYLEELIPVEDFNFDLMPQFTTSSNDESLLNIAKAQGKRYTGSSSSMTGILSHFHYLLSRNRPLNNQTISRSFPIGDYHKEFTPAAKVPASVFLRWKDGVYAIDADKEHNKSNVLGLLGQSLEKLLTLDKSDYLKYRKDSKEPVPEDKLNEKETYNYTGLGDMLMRSQLDAHDSRLPGTGVFDLKTRAIWPIRTDVVNYQEGRDYEIKSQYGEFESYEREYLDMMRATALKYMLQVRLGRMDGIFVAFHNTQRIFGFQYIPLEELDLSLHGQADRTLGDQEFKLSVSLLNDVLKRATEVYPETSMRLLFRTVGGQSHTRMLIFVEPMTEKQVDEIQHSSDKDVAAQNAEILAGKPPQFANGKRVLDYSLVEESHSDNNIQDVIIDEVWDAAIENRTIADNGDIPALPETEATSISASIESEMNEPDLAEESKTSLGPSCETDGPDRDAIPSLSQPSPSLLAFELKVKNIVNGAEIKAPGFEGVQDQVLLDRQADSSTAFSTKSGDRWDVSYTIKRLDRESAWSAFLAARRARESVVDENQKENAGLAAYRRLGKQWAAKGKLWRDLKDEETSGTSKVVLGDVRPKSS